MKFLSGGQHGRASETPTPWPEQADGLAGFTTGLLCGLQTHALEQAQAALAHAHRESQAHAALTQAHLAAQAHASLQQAHVVEQAQVFLTPPHLVAQVHDFVQQAELAAQAHEFLAQEHCGSGQQAVVHAVQDFWAGQHAPQCAWVWEQSLPHAVSGTLQHGALLVAHVPHVPPVAEAEQAVPQAVGIDATQGLPHAPAQPDGALTKHPAWPVMTVEPVGFKPEIKQLRPHSFAQLTFDGHWVASQPEPEHALGGKQTTVCPQRIELTIWANTRACSAATLFGSSRQASSARVCASW
jgi:hypothetical protein